MVLRGKEDGRITRDTHTIVEYSSGSTVISLSLIANIMGIPKVKAYMSNKTSEAKLNLLRFFVSLSPSLILGTHFHYKGLDL